MSDQDIGISINDLLKETGNVTLSIVETNEWFHVELTVYEDDRNSVCRQGSDLFETIDKVFEEYHINYTENYDNG